MPSVQRAARTAAKINKRRSEKSPGYALVGRFICALRPLSTGSDAFITPLRRADDVSGVTDDFRSKRSFASRRSSGTRVSLTRTEYSPLV